MPRLYVKVLGNLFLFVYINKKGCRIYSNLAFFLRKKEKDEKVVYQENEFCYSGYVSLADSFFFVQ
jgi:hypothetical protein